MSVFLSFAFLAAILAHTGCNNQRRGPEASGRRFNRIQHGQCTYTFILPEQDGNCRESTTDQYNTNALQRDAPHVEQDFSSQKLQHLEHVMENYTQWLQKTSALVTQADVQQGNDDMQYCILSTTHGKAEVFNTYFWLSNENRHFIFLASENLS
ncbi:hypothetical protein Q9233_014460 [Columba guinea]|nr:hypothetical protein Q9233_014460 [Columba guinea]